MGSALYSIVFCLDSCAPRRSTAAMAASCAGNDSTAYNDGRWPACRATAVPGKNQVGAQRRSRRRQRPDGAVQSARVARRREGRPVQRRRVSGRRRPCRKIPAGGSQNYNVRVREPCRRAVARLRIGDALRCSAALPSARNDLVSIDRLCLWRGELAELELAVVVEQPILEQLDLAACVEQLGRRQR